MSMNLGINVVEVDGATPSLQGAPTSVAGFVIRSQRGVPGVVRQVSNFTQFTDYFGGYVATGNNAVGTATGTQTSYVGAYAIRGFFDNGGSLAYVSRVVDATTAVAASASLATIATATGTSTVNGITLTAAFRGQADPGTWGNAVNADGSAHNGLVVSIAPNSNAANGFDLTVAWATTLRGTTTYKVLESWTKLVIGGAAGAQDPTVLNDPNTGSKYVSFASSAVTGWQGGHAYSAGAFVTNGGNTYVATAGGTSAANAAGPVGTGTIPADGTVTWTFAQTATAAAWTASTAYTAGTVVTSGSNTYVATVGGTSAAGSGPTGTGAAINDGTGSGAVTWAYVPAAPPAWQAGHAYTAGTVVKNGANVYVVTTAGTSAPAATGPTGSSTSTDGGVTWAYVSPSVTPAAWQAGQAATVGNTVTIGGSLYQVTDAGTTAAGPTGTGTGIADGGVTWAHVSAWAGSHAYALGDTAINGSTVYVVTTAGSSAATGGPSGTGTGITDGGVTWAAVPTTSWQPGTAYAVGAAVSNGTNPYVATTGGTSAGPSATGPTGSGSAITDGSVLWTVVGAWQGTHAYSVGSVVTNGGVTYVATKAGSSAASGGPTGTGAGIGDGGVTWSSQQPAAWRTGTRYALGATVTNGASVYKATAAGTSATATGAGAFTDGSVTWASLGGGYTPLANGADDLLDGLALDSALAAQLSVPSPFDPYDIELLACPETSDPGVIKAALTYCSNRGDCMFVGHSPDGFGVPETKAWVQNNTLQEEKAYGALYFPYIQIVDPIGTTVWIPPEGHVMGVYARTDQQRGIWKAPAGNGALVDNALDVRTRITDTDHTDLVKNGSVNAIRPITGAGIVVDSSRTLSTNTLWLYVNVRLLFNYVKTSLKYGLRWVVQEPNSTELWNKIKFNSVTPFLMGLWRRGAFGPGAPKDVFTVKVDAENNPPANIQQGILNIEVYFYPSRPAETIIITVGQQEGAATASEG